MYAQPPRGGFSHYLLVHLGEGEPQIDVVEPGHLEVQTVAGKRRSRAGHPRARDEHDGATARRP